MEAYRALLGKKVKLTYRYEDRDKEALISVGVLLGVGDGGDFEILEEDGFVHYGWPMLHIEEDV